MRYRIVIFNNNYDGNTIFGKSDWITKKEYNRVIEELKKPSMFGNNNFIITTETKEAFCIEDCICGTCKYNEMCCHCDCDICEDGDCNCVYCNKYEED